MNKWHKRFMEMADLISTWSKDPSTGVGAVIVGYNREIISMGYNGFPRGVNDDIDHRYERPQKYMYTEHAERNAIYNAVLTGSSPVNGTIYTTKFTCADCARAIIQCGIKNVYTWDQEMDGRWKEHFMTAVRMYSEAGVKFSFVKQT